MEEERPVDAQVEIVSREGNSNYFFYRKSVHLDFLHDRGTVNAQHYCQMLDGILAKKENKIRQKRDSLMVTQGFT